MVLNEILIPQDSLTETNVTRKRSVVGNSRLHSQNHFIQNFIILLLFYFLFIFESTTTMIKLYDMPK